MKKITVIVSVLFIIILTIFLMFAQNMSSFTRLGAVGPGFVPKLLLYCGIICAIFVILESLFFKKQQNKVVTTNIMVCKVVLLAIVYVLLINTLGYFISTFFALSTLMYMLGVKNKLQIIGVSLGFLVVVYVIFVVFLSIPLPKPPFLGGVI